MATTKHLIARAYWGILGLVAGAAVAVIVVLAAHTGHSPAVITLTGHAASTVRNMRPIPPVHPLPGASPADWATYLHAKATYCALVPSAPICS